jgi:hypothetical protein
MKKIAIQQALMVSHGNARIRLLARSAGFADEWLPEAEQLCAGFGERPVGVSCSASVFAQPFGKTDVAVVQVADLGLDEAGRASALGFRFLVLARKEYAQWLGDPFCIADRFPPAWDFRSELPALSLPAQLLPSRTVAEIQEVLKGPESPALLGGVQALIDGARLIFRRPAPEPDLVRALWSLLPTSTRCNLWPASFAFGNALGFDALMAPRSLGEEVAGYLTEEQAADYPEGRYELNLQIAAEAGDQGDLDALFARRSRTQTWRLGLVLLAAAAILTLAMRLLHR